MFACSHPTSLSLIYHLATYFCTWQGMVYVSLHSQSRALDVECDVSKLCWYFVFLCRSALTQSYFRFTSFMKTKISIYPRMYTKQSNINWLKSSNTYINNFIQQYKTWKYNEVCFILSYLCLLMSFVNFCTYLGFWAPWAWKYWVWFCICPRHWAWRPDPTSCSRGPSAARRSPRSCSRGTRPGIWCQSLGLWRYLNLHWGNDNFASKQNW